MAVKKYSMKPGNKVKKLLAEYARKIARRHLVMGAMGNISVRESKVVWIKRGGAWLERARPQDFIAVDVRSGRAKFGRLPSKEVFLHLGCYKSRADIMAVVHTHPVMATALATAGVNLSRSSPGFRQIVDSKIVTLRYYPPGSKKLAGEVRRAVKKANAVILANHGLVTVGSDIREAYQRTLACEEAARRILLNLRK